MREIGSSSTNSLGHEINVLLVDDDKEMLYSPNDSLQFYSYKVTKVETAAGALSLLCKGMKEFDLVLIDIHIPDMDAFTLLKLVAKMDLLTMLMSEIDDDATISKALKSGAFLLLRKPFIDDVVKQLRQHVIRERKQKGKKYDDETNVIVDEELNDVSENRNQLKRKAGISINETKKSRKAENGVVKNGSMGRNQENIKVHNGRSKRKTCTEWTEELHQKFMDAVNELGDGRCYPMEILETMNVPGLTRKQVASHLQKCRNHNWQTPEMRKSRHLSCVQGSNERSQRRDNLRYGSMPHIDQIQPENICRQEITPTLCSTENGARQTQQNGRVRNRFGSYPFMRNGGGRPNLNDGTPTLEDNYIADQTVYTPIVEKPSDDHSYDPINLDVGQNQQDDEFFNYFNEDMDDHVPDLTAVLDEGSIVNQATMTNHDLGGHWNTTATNFFGNR